MSEENLKRTTLYETHLKYGGKMVPFAGWEMPVQYKAGVINEHMAVRTACGMFDVSHMGEITIEGPDALANLNYLLTNDFSGMADGQARYSPMCNEEGGVVDDLIVYKKDDDEFLMVVNAANKDKDFSWMKAHAFGDAVLEDISQSLNMFGLGTLNSTSISFLMPTIITLCLVCGTPYCSDLYRFVTSLYPDSLMSLRIS